MKKIFYVTGSILFLLALSLTSCEDEKTPEELLIGKWDMESEHYTEYTDGVKTDENTYTYDPGEEAIEFLEGGTGKIYEDGVANETFSWEISGDILTVTEPGDEDEPMDMDFTVSETGLTLEFSSEETFEGVVYKSEAELILSR
jgi:hypothetical protein